MYDNVKLNSPDTCFCRSDILFCNSTISFDSLVGATVGVVSFVVGAMVDVRVDSLELDVVNIDVSVEFGIMPVPTELESLADIVVCNEVEFDKDVVDDSGVVMLTLSDVLAVELFATIVVRSMAVVVMFSVLSVEDTVAFSGVTAVEVISLLVLSKLVGYVDE